MATGDEQTDRRHPFGLARAPLTRQCAGRGIVKVRRLPPTLSIGWTAEEESREAQARRRRRRAARRAAIAL